jgi:hypothetical protein
MSSIPHQIPRRLRPSPRDRRNFLCETGEAKGFGEMVFGVCVGAGVGGGV